MHVRNEESFFSEVTNLTLKQAENEKSIALKDRQLSQLQELCRRLKTEQSPNDNVKTETDVNPENEGSS